jgi:LysR family transcriptional regulator, transcriptional activator of the cysJI operon
VDQDSLKLFRDIAATRSFSRAAALNGFSQSAVSQQVQELERALGVTLLDRSRRPLVVTPAGHLYEEFCRDVLRRRKEFEAALGLLKHDTGGTVRVASIYSVGLSEMVELERLFAQRQPEAILEVQYLQPAKVYAAVLADKVDLGLVSYPHGTREIKVIPWRQEEMVLATAPDHRLAKKAAAIRGPIPMDDLNGIDFVGFDEELPIRADVDRFFREKGVEVNVSVHFDNIEMIKEAVAHRVGVSIMPHRVMREDIRQKRLAAIRMAGASLYRPLGIIHRKTKRFQPVAQAFLDLLCEKPVPEAA